ncbi:MAG: trypsin-like peptidase domain-containing protein [Acidimicrobiales bacterium]
MPPSSGAPRRLRRGGLAAAVAVAALIAGTAGGVAGAVIARDDAPSPSSSTAAPNSTPVTTALGPVDGDSAEPAAAVAAALGPAVVQIETQRGLGSGFVYDASGLILTASHVTDGAQQVQVRLADGSKLAGDVLGEDPSTDVAVVQIDPPDGLAVATLATGVDIQVGQTAIAIGSPFGLDQTVTAGIVSAVGRSSETPGGVIPAIQTDAPINSGNSGGALADRQGRIIGINDSIITGGQGSTGNVGVGFAIPIDIAKAVADKIVAGQPTSAGFLGVEGADATGTRAGAAITSVEQGSPADQAGLSDQDVVVAVDGGKVSSMIDLAAAIRTHQPGDDLTLTVVRGGQERQVTVTLGAARAN